MNWRFWKKDNSGNDPGATAKKLPRPKDLPQEIGRHLVVEESLDPDWVWSLKCVMLPQAEGATIYDFRIFSESSAEQKGVRVKNYTALDDQPDLILFEGWIDRKSRQFKFEKTLQEAV